MSFDEVFESWKQERGRANVPPGFADRVLARLPATRRWYWVQTALASPAARIAACLLAGAACLFRAANVLGLFLPG